MGQPQLKKKLEMPSLLQFRQRISVHYHLYPLDQDEAKGYINHRIKLVSNNGMDIFTDDAMDTIFRYSKGVPRVINLVCDSALLSGFTYDKRKIDSTMIEEVVNESRFESKKVHNRKDNIFDRTKQQGATLA